MSYSEQVRHPGGALDPPKKNGGISLWWWVIGGIMAFVLVAIFRPQWLAKIGIQVNSSGASTVLGHIANPHGWV